ncbi:permease [bacterium]|nr:permease [bacterium]
MTDLYYRVLDLFRHTYTARIVSSFFELLLMVAPYFCLSVIINVCLRRWICRKRPFPQYQSRIISIIIAAVAGLVSPFPTYIAVPMGVSLLSLGIPFGAVVAFMISSPLMNPGIFLLTLSQLGWEIALARILAAFFLALIAGIISERLGSRIDIHSKDKDKRMTPQCGQLYLDIRNNFLFLGKYFLLAIFLSALVKALVPPELISRLLGGRGSMSLVAAIALGVPFYSCGGAAIPLVQVLSEMGMNRGAILAFFIAGPSTKLETVVVYRSVAGIRFLWFYLLYTLTGAMISGLIFLAL